MIEHIDTFALLTLLLVAVWTDQRTHRIPNLLVVAMLCCGLAIQSTLHGMAGLSDAGLGVLAGFGVFVIPYIKGAMAAGDVKLIAATGAFLGPIPVLLAGGLAMIAGASIGAGLLALQHHRGANLSVEQMLTTRFPFAAAIAVGVSCVLIIQETQ